MASGLNLTLTKDKVVEVSGGLRTTLPRQSESRIFEWRVKPNVSARVWPGRLWPPARRPPWSCGMGNAGMTRKLSVYGSLLPTAGPFEPTEASISPSMRAEGGSVLVLWGAGRAPFRSPRRHRL